MKWTFNYSREMLIRGRMVGAADRQTDRQTDRQKDRSVAILAQGSFSEIRVFLRKGRGISGGFVGVGI